MDPNSDGIKQRNKYLKRNYYLNFYMQYISNVSINIF